MNDTKTKAEARVDPPPLRLVHLLLYMTVFGAYLSFVTLPNLRSSGRPLSLREASDFNYRRIIELPQAAVAAAALTVVLLLIVWTCRRKRVWDQPGHWIALWTVWQMVSIHCVRTLIAVIRWVGRINTFDDYVRFWEWGKCLYALQTLPFAVLFLLLAAGLRRVANTWPWRLYFAALGLWLCYQTMAQLQFHWSGAALVALSKSIPWFDPYWLWQYSPVLLLLAMANDLRPGKPRRHWSHWLMAVLPLVNTALSYLPPLVWNYLHPTNSLLPL